MNKQWKMLCLIMSCRFISWLIFFLLWLKIDTVALVHCNFRSFEMKNYKCITKMTNFCCSLVSLSFITEIDVVLSHTKTTIQCASVAHDKNLLQKNFPHFVVALCFFFLSFVQSKGGVCAFFIFSLRSHFFFWNSSLLALLLFLFRLLLLLFCCRRHRRRLQ